MKLRLRGNTLRLRLTRPEVASVAKGGVVSERTEFGAGEALVYEMDCRWSEAGVTARFDNGSIRVWVNDAMAHEWATTERVGMEGRSGPLAILIEKDFQCTHGERDADAFESTIGA